METTEARSPQSRRHVEVYRREDKKWAWRLVAANGRILATDGGQGYENRKEAIQMVESLWTMDRPTDWRVLG